MWLKIFLTTTLITVFVFSCTPVKKATQSPAKPEKIELVPQSQDSTEYELIIIDPGFESWFNAHHKPVWYYSKEYLVAWNTQYVLAWNEKVRNPLMNQGDGDNPFILEIDYKPFIDYGLDLNYKLYNYFKYIEATWGKILSYERRI